MSRSNTTDLYGEYENPFLPFIYITIVDRILSFSSCFSLFYHVKSSTWSAILNFLMNFSICSCFFGTSLIGLDTVSGFWSAAFNSFSGTSFGWDCRMDRLGSVGFLFLHTSAFHSYSVRKMYLPGLCFIPVHCQIRWGGYIHIGTLANRFLRNLIDKFLRFWRINHRFLLALSLYLILNRLNVEIRPLWGKTLYF